MHRLHNLLQVAFRLKFFALTLIFMCFCGALKSQQFQETNMRSASGTQVVIGFPGITQKQLNDFKAEYQKHPEIVSAKYFFGNDNCMLLKVDPSKKKNLTYYDLVKCTAEIFPMEKCYLKPPSVFSEIEPNNLNAVVVIIK